jgi:Peptidase family M23
MNRSAGKWLGGAALCVALLGLAACDAGNAVLWPWVDHSKEDANGTTPASGPNAGPASVDPNRPPPPPPPTTPVNPLDPSRIPDAPTVPNPNANTGAPASGTPFIEKPENAAIPISDTSTPVSAETGKPVTPLPPPTDTPKPADPASPSAPPTAPSTTPSFYYFTASLLEPGSGLGATETKVLVPDMVFPIKDAPAHPQSQVYRYGGSVKGGDQCDPRNFSAPWRDTYCETRQVTATTPWCPSKGVHLGQDIRVGTPEGCKLEKAAKAADRTRYAVVAVEDGIISNVGSFSINLRAASGGRIYRYLHLNMTKLKVKTGQSVRAGEVVGYVSNDFGGTPTTLHLHFEISLNTAENGWQYAPPYSSLLAAYQRREKNLGEKVADNFVVASAPK